MKALIFNIIGNMAHFRRFYSSVTPLSYSFPPRNTVAGILASILGYERDSYYNIFSRENFGLSVSINNKNGLRRLMLPTNYLDTDQVSITRLRGKGKVPTTIEYIVAMPPDNELSYRLYVVLLNEEYRDIIEELETRIKRKESTYPLSLGPVNCLARVEWVASSQAEIIERNDRLPIRTVIPIELIANGGIVFEQGKKIIFEERLPPDFADGREKKGESKNYIFEWRGDIINVNLKTINKQVFKVNIMGEDVYGVFM